MTLKCTMILGNCLDVMPELPQASAPMVLADLPYGLISQQWDTCLPLDEFWACIRSARAPGAVTCCVAVQPFTSKLINSNVNDFRYDVVWIKSRASNFFQAKTRPLRVHETVLIFASTKHTFNPQMSSGKSPVVRTQNQCFSGNYGIQHKQGTVTGRNDGLRYPTSALYFASGRPQASKHPTQKPVALFNNLIRTYSNLGDTVLDPVSGSFTTSVAACLSGRSSIGIEKDPTYFEAGVERVRKTVADNRLDVAIEVRR